MWRAGWERARLRFADFHRLPENTPQRDTNLRPNEIVTAIELPARGFAANYTYLKIRDRLSYAFALVSVAAALELEGDTIKEARLALGGVAHKPWRDPSAEAALRGQDADQPTFTSAADVLLRDAKGFEHNAFKIDLARRAIVRALTQAAAGTPQSQSDKKIRVSRERAGPMTHLHRHRHIPRRWPRQGHRRGKIRRRVQCGRPRACQCRCIHHRQGPHRAHRRERGAFR